MLLLVSDTNILIDLEVGNLTPVIFRLPFDIAVPDILFESELREQHSHLLKSDLKVKRLTATVDEWRQGLSQPDVRHKIL